MITFNNEQHGDKFAPFKIIKDKVGPLLPVLENNLKPYWDCFPGDY